MDHIRLAHILTDREKIDYYKMHFDQFCPLNLENGLVANPQLFAQKKCDLSNNHHIGNSCVALLLSCRQQLVDLFRLVSLKGVHDLQVFPFLVPHDQDLVILSVGHVKTHQ